MKQIVYRDKKTKFHSEHKTCRQTDIDLDRQGHGYSSPLNHT